MEIVIKRIESSRVELAQWVLTLVIIMFPLYNYGQNKNGAHADLSSQWVSQNVQSLDFNTDKLDDLEFLKNEIGDKRIVAIGEQTHSDGATFQLRARMIEYLIEEMGFEVILFEAGMFDLYYANQAAQKSKKIDSLKNGLYWFWKNADQHKHLFAYLEQQLEGGKNIEFGGFDCKLTSGYGRNRSNYMRMLKEQVATLDVNFLSSKEFISYQKVWNKIDADMKKGGLGSISFKMKEKEQSEFLKQSSFIQKWLQSRGQLEWAQMVKTVDESVVLYSDFSLGKALFNKAWFLNLNNQRDRLMAENLQYLLATKYAHKKVILFGATYHFARNIQSITPKKVQGFAVDQSITSGSILHPFFKNEMYTIGFTAYDGTYGYVKKGVKGKAVSKASEKNLAYQLAKQKYDAAFVPLKNSRADSQYWFKEPIIRLFNYKTNTSARDWSTILDAVVYIKTMTPVTH